MNKLDKEYDEAYKILQVMRKFGGSFVKQLGEMINRADIHNIRIIRDSWPHYWKHYKEIARACAWENIGGGRELNDDLPPEAAKLIRYAPAEPKMSNEGIISVADLIDPEGGKAWPRRKN